MSATEIQTLQTSSYLLTPEKVEQLLRKIEALEEKVDELEDVVKRQEKVIEQQEKEISSLKNRLRKYENPHTPPSQDKFRAKDKDKQKGGRRGAPKGHRGATRERKEPDETVRVIGGVCENCGSDTLTVTGTEENLIEETPKPVEPVRVTKFIRDKVVCNSCGHQFTVKHRDCPQKGIFGAVLLTNLVMARFCLRGPLRKVADYMKNTRRFEISPSGLDGVMRRIAESCKNEYKNIHHRVCESEWKYCDETSFYVDCKKVKRKKSWLWIFRSKEGEVLTVIRPSRGGKVLKEIFRDAPRGVAIVDGWKPYNLFERIQRCWAHLLRVVDEYKEKSDEGKQLSEEIHRRFSELKAYLEEEHCLEKRTMQKELFDKQMADLVEQFSEYDKLTKAVKHIRNGLGNWYTCVLYPGMEPTNNFGEQSIREHVIFRKIIGAFRSEKGAEHYQYIASLLATWSLQGKNVYEELEALLRKELCGVA